MSYRYAPRCDYTGYHVVLELYKSEILRKDEVIVSASQANKVAQSMLLVEEETVPASHL